MSLIIVASSFTIICAKLGKSSPIKKPWKIPDTGREYYQVGTLLTLHNAQCSYREGHAYMVKNFTVCLLGPTTKFYEFEMARIGNFQNKCFQGILRPYYFCWFCLVFC